jgi:ABC-type branched-subunit amino acid transport system ATPase component
MSIEALIKNAKFTVLLGKNGAGKSTQLRTLITPGSLNTKYISPERGGKLKYDANVDTNISNSPTWLDQSRLQNRFEQFREQSAVQFRNLEILVLREIEQDISKRNDLSYTFDQILEKINNLLPHIKLIRSDRGFSIQSKLDQPINEEQISSHRSLSLF